MQAPGFEIRTSSELGMLRFFLLRGIGEAEFSRGFEISVLGMILIGSLILLPA